MDRLRKVAAKHDGVFSRHDAEASGCTAQALWRAVARGEIVRLFDEVYRFAAAPDTWRARARAANLAGGPLCGLSHRSARVVYGLPASSDAVTEVLCLRWERLQYEWLRVHEFSGLEPSDLVVVDGLRVVVPELAVLQLAGPPWVTVDQVEHVIYAARRRGWLTNASLQEYLYRRARRGRPGVRNLRAALARSLRHPRPTDSGMETMLLQLLRRHGFPEPVLQYEVRDEKGIVIATVDAALAEWMILFEYDSDQEHVDPVDIARDNRRRLWATKHGCWMLPVRKADLQSGGHDLADAIRGAIARLEGRPQPA